MVGGGGEGAGGARGGGGGVGGPDAGGESVVPRVGGEVEGDAGVLVGWGFFQGVLYEECVCMSDTLGSASHA